MRLGIGESLGTNVKANLNGGKAEDKKENTNRRERNGGAQRNRLVRYLANDDDAGYEEAKEKNTNEKF